MRDNIGDTAKSAQLAVEAAMNPVLKNLTHTIEQASQEKQQLKRVLGLLSWKTVLVASAILLSVIGVLLFANFCAVWWTRTELESLREQQAQMEQNLDTLRKANAHIHVSRCGKHSRPCVEVDTSEAFGDRNNAFYILKNVK